MVSLRALLGFGARGGLSPLERRLLQELGAALSPTASDLLARQVESLNLVQRHARGREICCYTMRGRSVRRDPSARFPNRSQDLKLATIRFDFHGYPGEWSARFYLVDGYFFSILFSSPTQGVQSRDDVRVIETRLHADPLRQEWSLPQGNQAEVQLPEWVLNLATQHDAGGVRPPLPQETRRERILEVTATLPGDYLDLMTQTDGLTVRDCEILGLSEIREVMMEETSYFVIAELGGNGALVVRDGESDGRLYYLDYEGNLPRDTAGFREAVEQYVSRLADLS